MSATFDRLSAATPAPGQAGLFLPAAAARSRTPAADGLACFHCGSACPDHAFSREEKVFCCQGCLVVHDLLAEHGLDRFYSLERHPGSRIGSPDRRDRWRFLDEPGTREKLLDFCDAKLSRVTFHLPAIHCVACVWLLENVFRLHAGIGESRVNFPRREVVISFAPERLALSELAALLASIGYEPQLTLNELEGRKPAGVNRRQWLQVGVAGFAFGNIMLFSLPSYFGLDTLGGPGFRALFGWLSLALATPVVFYSASDYWRSAFVSVRQRVLTLDVPIALGLAALYLQSSAEVLLGRGQGYLDSLVGLVFFLLCGRLFQQKTHARMAFDRDYRCFFPLSVMRRTPDGEASVAISSLRVGDRLRLRHGEMLPADATLLSGNAWLDYSFVSGESEPVARQTGDHLYAGGRQAAGAIEVEIVKPVSQSYLASLWDHAAFRKSSAPNLNTLTNRYSRRFTRLVLGVALGAALFWILSGEAARGLKSFTSVLIVACPCALALASPFALGTAQRLLNRARVFLKNILVLERIAEVDTIVFDKTGTLTDSRANRVSFQGEQGRLSPLTAARLSALARHSSHPHARRIHEWLSSSGDSIPVADTPAIQVEDFLEVPGLGISAHIDSHDLRLGSRNWLESSGITIPPVELQPGSASFLAIDGIFAGVFQLGNALRPETGRLLNELGARYELALLSGDNPRERDRFRELFGPGARLHFNLSPPEKLEFVGDLQDSGKTVMMVGDGLNDAGALQQSDVGVAVIEQAGTFSPASDVIVEASQLPRLFRVLDLARRTTRLVRWSFGISAAYNLAGVSIAAAGLLSPLVCAVLMPLSSVSVVLFACGATRWAARKTGVTA